MAFLTDRKRATGLGSAKAGTEHFWAMTVSSVALLFLVPLFVFTIGSVIGEDLATVQAHFARPWVAILTGLTLTIGLLHFKNGARTFVEDYTQGLLRKLIIIDVTLLSYAAIACGLFALIRLAL